MKSMALPRYLDEPERFLLWTLDEAMVMFVPMVAGLLWHHSGMGLLCGVSLFAMYHQLKTYSHGFFIVKGFCYWHGLCPAIFWRHLPLAWHREVLG